MSNLWQNSGSQPNFCEVMEVARTTVSVLHGLGFPCCLVGGFACLLFGNLRTPGDVDIVVLDTTESQESLKRMIVEKDSRFYLVDSKAACAMYKVLWYRLSPTYLDRSCKVDVLQPGIMNIPVLNAGRVVTIHDLPVMPFSIVLLLKLQAWTDHQESRRMYLREKQYTDEEDISRLLPLARAQNMKPRDESYIPSTFISAAERRIDQFVIRFPTSADYWRALGFKVIMPSPPRVEPATPKPHPPQTVLIPKQRIERPARAAQKPHKSFYRWTSERKGSKAAPAVQNLPKQASDKKNPVSRWRRRRPKPVAKPDDLSSLEPSVVRPAPQRNDTSALTSQKIPKPTPKNKGSAAVIPKVSNQMSHGNDTLAPKSRKGPKPTTHEKNGAVHTSQEGSKPSSERKALASGSQIVVNPVGSNLPTSNSQKKDGVSASAPVSRGRYRKKRPSGTAHQAIS